MKSRRSSPLHDEPAADKGRRHRGLGEKIVAASMGLVFIMTLSIVGVLVWLYKSTRGTIEHAVAGDEIRRLALLIDDDIAQLDMTVRDWAYWDDCYEFAAGRNPGFIKSNVGDGQHVSRLNLSVFAIKDTDGNIIYRFEDRQGLAELVCAGVEARGTLTETGKPSGIVVSGDEIHLVAARAILSSDMSEPPLGSVTMARRIDGPWLERGSRLLDRDVNVSLSPGDRAIDVIAVDWNDDTTTVSMDVPARGSADSVRLSLVSPSLATRYGVARFIVLLLIVLGIIVGAGAPVIFILEAKVFGRMRRIGSDLDELLVSGDPDYRIDDSGDDELASLCLAVNRSLDQLGSIIDERDEMLREIHHRVKNNLQVIASLLNLQAYSTDDGETLEALEVNRKRVQIMAIVHEAVLALPSGRKLAVLPLLEHVSYIAAHSRCRYGDPLIRFSGDDLDLGMDTALLVALIVGEAIDEALARPHPDGQSCDIALEVGRLGASQFFVEIKDGNRGIPAGDGRGFGFVIIEALSLQLRGTFSTTTGVPGKSFFRLEAPRA